MFPELIDALTKRLSNLKITTESMILVFDKGNNSKVNIKDVLSIIATYFLYFGVIFKKGLGEGMENVLGGGLCCSMWDLVFTRNFTALINNQYLKSPKARKVTSNSKHHLFLPTRALQLRRHSSSGPSGVSHENRWILLF